MGGGGAGGFLKGFKAYLRRLRSQRLAYISSFLAKSDFYTDTMSVHHPLEKLSRLAPISLRGELVCICMCDF